jgi:DNA-binding GntR family transcriptional regulator
VEQKEHEEILEAMKKRNPRGLVSALRQHILRAREAMLGSLDES